MTTSRRAPSGDAVENRCLVASEISYQRDGRSILDRVSVTALPGTVTAIIGPSGSGKSTLLAILAALDEPDSGTVSSPFVADETAVILQAYGLVSLLTAAENVEIALQSDARCGRREIRNRAADALDSVGLATVANHLTETLSGGQQQRVAIARALVTRPRLLIADEFSAELDRGTRDCVNELIQLVARGGGTVIVATHDADLAVTADQTLDLG